MAYSLLISNPAMVLCGIFLDAYTHDDPRITISAFAIWWILAGSTALSLCGATLMGCYMNASHRPTFYTHLPLKRYVDQLWAEREEGSFRAESPAAGLDASRAHLLKFSWRYWVSTLEWGPADENLLCGTFLTHLLQITTVHTPATP